MSSKMVEYASQLGLEAEDLEECISVILEERAQRINADGLAGQIEFLFSDFSDGDAKYLREYLNELAQNKQVH